MLYASLALGLVAIAGLALVGLLRQLGRFAVLSNEGPAP